ncbi:protein of unknown function [Ruminococcaceae bacterium BL-6]|nr:protein of unknown function [Ruminococcaceae bacterium BL-6]
MDAKYLAEIKARTEAATSGLWWPAECREGFAIYVRKGRNSTIIAKVFNTLSDTVFIANAKRDILALLAEVERLQKCLENSNEFRRRMEEKARKADSECATLKRALEGASKYIVEFGRVDYFLCDDIPQELHLKYQPKNDGNYENGPCIKCVQEYFIQKAQEAEK